MTSHMTGKMTIELLGDTQVRITRPFRAPPELLYRAHTEPALIQRWLLGPDGWTMPVCQSDPRPGGSFRYEWTDGTNGFHITGDIIDCQPFSRLEHVERMFLPQQTPDNHIVTEFRPDGAGTVMTLLMTLPDQATREAMLATGMEYGMETSYARMEAEFEAA